jgi:hypothetical protein
LIVITRSSRVTLKDEVITMTEPPVKPPLLPKPPPKPDWPGKDDEMEDWVNWQLNELLPLRREARPPSEEDEAVRAAFYRRDIEPLRELVRKQHPSWVRYINRPIGKNQGDRAPFEYTDDLIRAIEDVELINELWELEYPDDKNRPKGAITAVDIAATRNDVPKKKLRTALKRVRYGKELTERVLNYATTTRSLWSLLRSPPDDSDDRHDLSLLFSPPDDRADDD